MKKVLIGICGIGNGHINRQKCVISELISNNYEVVVATDKNLINSLKKEFPKLKIVDIVIPWIVCDKNGLNYKQTFEKYKIDDYFKKFLEFGIKVEKAFSGKPNLIISDYEPNVAQYAYSQGIPLITMEQQSKFLYLDEVKIENQSIREEICRLNYFFPKYDKKIISSFFPINIRQKEILIVPPIVSKSVKQKTQKDFIVVYLSPYSDSLKYEQLINILKNMTNKKFKIFSNNTDAYNIKYQNYKNLEFSSFNEKFKNDLEKCEALITTGGHQLISEAINLNIPMFVMPLDTYEQKYNAYIVYKYGLGMTSEISFQSINEFFNKTTKYTNNILKYKKKYYKNSWEELFMSEVKDMIK